MTSDLDDLAARCRAAGIRLCADGARWDVVLDAPARRNSQTPATWRALAAVGAAVREHRPRVVVLAATGPSFSAGLDRAMFTGDVPGEPGLPQLAALPDAGIDELVASWQGAFTWWRDVDAVTVSAVHGHAVGAGFQLALATDLMLVADDVQLVMRETSLGLVPDLAGTGPLVAAVGTARAIEICVTGRAVGAAEAARIGLALGAVPAAGLAAAVDDLVAALTTAPAGAAVATTRLLRGAATASPPEQRSAERAAQAVLLRALAEERPSPQG